MYVYPFIVLASCVNFDTLVIKRLKKWGKLFGRTVPPNNKLFGRTLPPNNTIFGRTNPPNSTLFGRTPDFEKPYPISMKSCFG